MRRIVITGLIAAWTAFGTGCIAVSAKHNRIGMAKEVVAVSGRVYVIDKHSGRAREVDLSAARPFAKVEVTVTEHDD